MSELRPRACLNCGAPLADKFCQACGQRDIPPYPTVRELAMDAVSEFSGWDGRLATTLRELVRRPGVLTLEFLEGRRARYISPVRLYLSASVVYFLIAASAPTFGTESREVGGLRVRATRTEADSQPSRAARVGEAAGNALETGKALSAAEKEAALRDIARAPAPMRPFLRRAVEDPGGFQRGIANTLPRMLFLLLPVFAGILAIFYRGRKYPEHLYFAIHLHTFIFLALAAAAVTRFTQVRGIAAVATIIAAIVIPVYGILALRRVYDGSLFRNAVKALAIAAIYAATAATAFAIMVYWVSIAG